MGYPALAASAIRTASAAGTETNLQNLFMGARGVLFTLNVTAAAALIGDTLDVYIQQKINDNWDDLAHFTQVLGNGDAKVEVASLNFAETVSNDFHNPADASMAAATLRKGPITGVLRAKWVLGGGADKSFTFGVDIEILK